MGGLHDYGHPSKLTPGGRPMVLPEELRSGRAQWEAIRDSATSADAKAIIGALMLLVHAVDGLAGEVRSLREGDHSEPLNRREWDK
jgi:hypothetical protein